jgi:general secretion pathway protein E
MRIRMRVDGVLRDAVAFPLSAHAECIARLKVLAGLRTDEHHAAQDGRFRYGQEDTLDVRLSVMPTYYGENAVLRLLSDRGLTATLETLGCTDTERERLLSALAKRHGLFLATGPTGSGKTTTLYTLLDQINSSDVSIVTIEDPIEYSIADIKQIQVQPRTGLTFGTGLRSVLRQDPDIILVGEIRDAETARIAVNAALTGHLVLSTLHTSDALTTLFRLSDMGIDPYLIAATVEAALAQRLVRTLCVCARTHPVADGERAYFDRTAVPVATLADPVGCEACDGTGYRGRCAILELLILDGPLRDAIIRRASVTELRSLALRISPTTMFTDGLRKAAAGTTTLAEVLRVIHD